MTATPDLKSQREIRAPGPGPDAAELRAAYLGLLKLALCDLAGAATTSVEFLKDSRVFTHDLPPHGLAPRVDGRDWPSGGLSMAGLTRLDDLQECVETVVSDEVEGDLIEAGVWRGGASILMRATLDSLGAEGRTVWVADSFQGFPGDEDGGASEGEERTVLEFLSIPVEEVRASFERLGCGEGVEFVPGFFEQTMPSLHGGRWSLVRLDGDTYEATRVCLDALYPGLARGGYLIVDDYGAIEMCRKAVNDFRDEHGISEEMEQVDWTCVRWRRQDEPEPVSATGPVAGGEPPPGAAEVMPAARRSLGRRIPTIQELQLRDELAEARERLATAQAAAEPGRLSRLMTRLRRRRRR